MDGIAEDIRGIRPKRDVADTPTDTEVDIIEAPLSGVSSLVGILTISLELLQATKAIAHGRERHDPCTHRQMVADGEEDGRIVEITEHTTILLLAFFEERTS